MFNIVAVLFTAGSKLHKKHSGFTEEFLQQVKEFNEDSGKLDNLLLSISTHTILHCRSLHL